MSVQDQLHTLYLVDRQLLALRSRVDAAARRRAAQTTRLEQHERQHEELTTQLKEAKARVATQEKTAAGIDERVEALRQTMSNVKSNKEYSALLVEVNTLKTEKGRFEDAALTEMSAVDDLEHRLKLLETKTDEQRKLVAGAEKDVNDGESEIRDQLDELNRRREAAAGPIDANTLGLYDKLFEEFEGEALGEIEEQDRRRMEYTCGACFMSLPIQKVNATLTATDRPVQCSSCQRILFASGELKEALAPKEK